MINSLATQIEQYGSSYPAPWDGQLKLGEGGNGERPEILGGGSRCLLYRSKVGEEEGRLLKEDEAKLAAQGKPHRMGFFFVCFFFSCTTGLFNNSAVGYSSRRRKFEGRRRPAPRTRDDSDDRCMLMGVDVSMDRSVVKCNSIGPVGDSAISITVMLHANVRVELVYVLFTRAASSYRCYFYTI
jgi:hypothetical protein